MKLYYSYDDTEYYIEVMLYDGDAPASTEA